MDEKNNFIYEYSASIDGFKFFFGILNLSAIGFYFFTERYNTPSYIIFILLFDFVLLWNFFNRNHINRIWINKETEKIEISTSFLPMFEKNFSFTRDEINVIYTKEKLGRVSSGMVLQIKDLNDNLIGKMTPYLSYWDKETIASINEILDDMNIEKSADVNR